MLSTNRQTPNNTNELVSRLVILREKYLNLLLTLGRNMKKPVLYCAAKLLDYFRHWTEWKKETHRTTWIYQPIKKIRKDLFEEHSLHVIREAIAFLMEEGYLERRKNPGNGQDRTYQYRLVKLPTQNPSTETLTQSPFVRSESASVKPELCRVNADKYHSFVSTESIPTAANAAVNLNFELDREEETYPGMVESISDFQEAQEETLEELVVSDKVEEETKVLESISGEDHFPSATHVVPVQDEIQQVSSSSNDVLSEVENLVGDEMSPQLERFVLSQSVLVVKDAIAFVKEKLAKGQVIKKKAGYLITAVKSQFKPSSPSTPAQSQQKFPAGFEEWYTEARGKKQVADLEPRLLGISNGQPLVFVPKQRQSMPWYEAKALFDEQASVTCT